MSAEPIIKGWCPGAYRPMMSGDGLVVRVRPRMGRLDAAQLHALAHLSVLHGNGMIDLTSRANLQIRGVSEANHPDLLESLISAQVLDPTAEIEWRRNILTTPFPDRQGLTANLHEGIVGGLAGLPDLPAKMGIALDTGPKRFLAQASADFRFERSVEGHLILRADGAASGCAVTGHSALTVLTDLAEWFVASGGLCAGRMRRHLAHTVLPMVFQGHKPEAAARTPEPGPCADGYLIGAAFGSVRAQELDAVIEKTGTRAVRVTPWRMLLLEGVTEMETGKFVLAPGDPLLATHACPGTPFCTQAKARTRDVAAALAPHIPVGTSLHVSGCAKGCAHPGSADLTLVGVDGKFDLVRKGSAWDEPAVRGLPVDEILEEVTR